jgi:AcrR family transcriptional regulator
MTAISTFGRNRSTTAHVAELAGVSIGTVHRYFPDRFTLMEKVAPIPENIVRAPQLAAAALEAIESDTPNKLASDRELLIELMASLGADNLVA